MAVRGEEVASSIESHVRESIERMVEEIRSSVEDVRVAVDQQLKAALQSVQADVNSINFLPHIQRAIGDLEDDLTAAAPPAPAPAPSGAGVGKLKTAIQGIENARSQVDMLNYLLEQCLAFGSRAALLILRGETFSGWKGAGFSAHGGSDEAIKRFNAAPGLIPELDTVLRDERAVAWDGANLATRLGVSAAAQAVLVPMVIKDKVAAAVYVDAVDEDASKFDQDAIALLVFTTGLLVDTLAIRKKIPSPSLQASSGATAAPAAAKPAAPPPPPAAATPKPAPPPAPPAAPTPLPRPAAPPPQAVPKSTGAGTVAVNVAELREMMAAQRPSFNIPTAEELSAPTATAKVPAMDSKPSAATVAVPPPPPPAQDERPPTQYVPPPNLARGGAHAGPQTDDAKKHDEARRFARLLVSEIKLYNESKVEQGRRNNDLYERLKEDIDRSRQMYDERIADEVRKTSNYFYDELVRILADGRAEALGL